MSKYKVAVISPSAPIGTDDETMALVSTAEANLQTLDVEYVYCANARQSEKLSAAVIKRKIADIYAAFEDDTVDAIFCSQGGEKSIELLDHLDFDRLKNHFKPIFGLSDVTVLLNVISLLCGGDTYHGLDWIWGIGKNAGSYTFTQLKRFLESPQSAVLQPVDSQHWVSVTPGEGEGRLLGGCLCSFNLLLGTKYDPLELVDGDFILFVEDIGENFSRIVALFNQLALHPRFSHCKGVILGNFFLCKNDIPGSSIEAIAKQCFGPAHIPILKIPEIGHAVENMIIPIGALARLISREEISSLHLI